MTNIANLLSPEQNKALKATAKDLPYRVIKAATDPTPPRQVAPPETVVEWKRVTLADAEVTVINGVEVDLRSEGFIDTACADCDAPLRVLVAPKGVDLEVLTSRPRVAVCLDCGSARLRDQRGTLAHQPIQTPVQKKQETEVDLTKFSDAEFAALAVEARESMVAEAAETLPAKRKLAKQAEKDRAAQDEALKAQDDAKRAKRKMWMGEMSVKGVFVPTLDLTEVRNLDEAVSATMRSPYNKALYRLGEPLLDHEEATYRVLRKAHKHLWKHAEIAAEAPKVKAEAKREVKGDRLVADLDPNAKAKVEAFAKVSGMTLDQARERLASLSLIGA